MQGGRPDPIIEIEHYILDELEEDVNELSDALESLGVIVRRPEGIVRDGEITTPFWTTFQTPPLNVRDNTVIIGNTIVETSPHVRARYFENEYLKKIFFEKYQAGSKWICMPKASLAKNSVVDEYHDICSDDMEKYFVEGDGVINLESDHPQMIFDGAQCIRFGKDILVNVSSESHRVGYEWIKRHTAEDLRWHVVDKMADNHIDSILLPLKPGVLLLRDKSFRTKLPDFLHSWEILIPPEPREDHFPSYSGTNINISSKFIDMNILSVDEKTVVVNKLYPELCDYLEKKGFDVVPVRHRHRRYFGGGFHCFTLDLSRNGGMEDYR